MRRSPSTNARWSAASVRCAGSGPVVYRRQRGHGVGGASRALPLSLRLGQTGLTLFGDAGAAYEHGVKLADAAFEYGVGAGWYLRVPLFQLEVDVAYGFDSGTRAHVTAGLKF